jgi:hypothetical protein
MSRSIGLIALGFLLAAVLFITTSVLIAWTGPASAPPSGNVSAPINVGTTDQVKNAGLSLNSLAVFGNAILSGASRYLNFGTIAGSGGYGIRDDAGTMQFKNNGGSWTALSTSTSQWTTSGASLTYSGTITVNDAYIADRGLWASQLGRLGGQFAPSWGMSCPSGSVVVSLQQSCAMMAGSTCWITGVICQWINQ